MHKLLIKSGLAAGAITIVLTSAPAWALIPSSQIPPDTGGGNNAQVAKELAKTKLDSAKLKVCQNHEKTIKNIMGRISDRGQKRLDVYSKIATKVEAFYTKEGKTVSNYDALVADVNSKKDAAQAAVYKVKGEQADFTCDLTDPKGVAQGFKDDLKLEIQALHDYQQSVKNLIVAVKSANAGGQ